MKILVLSVSIFSAGSATLLAGDQSGKNPVIEPIAAPVPAPSPCPAHWYSGLSGDVFWVNDLDANLNVPGGLHRVNVDTGWGITFVPVGYRCCEHLAFELQTGIFQADVSSITTLGGVVFPVTDGDLTIVPIMFNSIFNLPVTRRFSAYAGFGLGTVYNELDLVAPAGGAIHSESSWDFGIQALGGVAFQVCPRSRVFLGYRYQHVFRSTDSISGHSIEGGITFNW